MKCDSCNEKDARYGYEYKKPIKCYLCKEDDMKIVVVPLCVVCLKTIPSYGLEKGKATHCSKCKTSDLIDVIHKKCDKCKKKLPSFGFEMRKPTRCIDCKEDGMFIVVHPLCTVCKKGRAMFGFDNGKPTHCPQCKTNNMIGLTGNMCRGCKKVIPTFGLIRGKPTHCKNCKTDAMFDAKSTLCSVCDKNRPIFGLCKGKPTHCSQCKTADMTDVVTRMCQVCEQVVPYFGLERGTPPTHCAKCKTSDMVNVKDKKCLTDWCTTTSSNPNYSGYCYHCFVNLFPDKPVARAYKRKETEVVKYLKENLNIEFITDKRVDGGCSKRRPDVMIDLLSHIVICEIDENQHSGYDNTCENKRLMEISQDLAHRPIVFIRFNPDGYTTSKGNVPSPWRRTRDGVTLIKENKYEWLSRLEKLKRTINKWCNKIPERTITIIQLFFSDNE